MSLDRDMIFGFPQVRKEICSVLEPARSVPFLVLATHMSPYGPLKSYTLDCLREKQHSSYRARIEGTISREMTRNRERDHAIMSSLHRARGIAN